MKDPKEIERELNEYFLGLKPDDAEGLLRKARRLARRKGMTIYNKKGDPRLISIAYRPWIISREQVRFFHALCLELKEALRKLLRIYWESDEAKRIIPLSEKEKEWFLLAEDKGLVRPQTIFDRLDATTAFDRPDWKENFGFLELNSVGVGGIHYISVACEVNRDVFLPRFEKRMSGVSFLMQPDIRDLLMEEMLGHARALGRSRASVAFIEDQSGPPGTHEYEYIVEYFRRKGVRAYLADPRELRLVRGEVYFGDKPVDVLYRDCEIDELVEIERGDRVPLEALKRAFMRNQVVSSFAGEFDHKSSFEIFTDSRFRRYFSERQRRIFGKYIPWTRLIWERKTLGPQGEKIDLAKYVRKNKDALVMKPNREYGGKGVTLGRFTSQIAWERMLRRALSNPSTVIVQQFVEIHKEPFPAQNESGEVELEDFFTVSAFVATKRRIAFLGRYSKERIVNVSRKGGLIPVYIVNGRLLR